ncbi:DUF4946 domain-containing protein [Pseudomonas sp. RTC3]|uniref:DUF4946 domain-containing protein n=1 Tax=unclassified Pseudomonas TaxID=196821 RepID=UPI002AB41C0C|nr:MULTISPECIES: DUF4946 domain-containing protein [unclassified Pseudomonas]MEB0064031.1 DUF4946 domain-containing protein [Pseudomonas sp. RTC3]MDY7564849.1 DUF4946 domain-containing protein [Pseudomonas sp. 5C2]MEB0005942.1 DUF4946 domain-containing protein [Pseudomonas sp. RTB2]MEB0017127.1 DUF4946 domain-containing protein [Pseudomonas sp. RTB3]MEB0026555.1 DUF4946 domain-containing protein [Pseudomonas sp. MH9.2]
MIYLQRRSSLISLCLLLGLSGVHAADVMITWPSGWEVEPLPPVADAAAQPSVQMRQRAVKNDQNGDPIMVMELTQSRLQPGHDVNVQSVLLEMRKSVQIDFARGGFQSVCSKIHKSTLSDLPALETTCTITQNGGHVMTQTLVAAASHDMAWSLSYAGSADGYVASKEEVQRIRDSLHLVVAP